MFLLQVTGGPHTGNDGKTYVRGDQFRHPTNLAQRYPEKIAFVSYEPDFTPETGQIKTQNLSGVNVGQPLLRGTQATCHG